MTAPRPAAVLAVLVGSVLSVATDPVPVDETDAAAAPVLLGTATAHAGEPLVVPFVAELSCTSPDAAGAPLPVVDAWASVELSAAPVDGGPDTAARTHVTASLAADGAADLPDEEWVRDDGRAWLRAATPFGQPCALGERCATELVLTVEADADVQVAWTAEAAVEWWRGPGNSCLVFLHEA